MTSNFTSIAKYLLIFGGIIFIACEDNNGQLEKSVSIYTNSLNSTQSNNSLLIESQFQKIATLHNDGLSLIHQELSSVDNDILETPQEVIQYSQLVTIDFMNSQFNQIGIQLDNNQTELANQMINWSMNNNWNNIETTNSHILNSNLTSNVKEYLIKINQIEAKNYGEIVSQLEGIRNEAKKNITNQDDLGQILGYLTIVSYSIKYWKDNQDDWKEMLTDLGFQINNDAPPCFVSGWDADRQMLGYLDDWTFGLWDDISDETTIWGGSAIIGASAGQAIWNWLDK